MTIDEAIKELEEAKKDGIKAIVFSWWSAEAFDMEDDEDWDAIAAQIESSMDWSRTHDSMRQIIQDFIEEEQ